VKIRLLAVEVMKESAWSKDTDCCPF